MRQHVLDANALYRFLTDGEGAELVGNVLKEAGRSDTPVMMSVVAWGEVCYTVVKHAGLAKADNLLSEARQKIGLTLVCVELEDAVKAARLKAQYNIPYADAFTAALAGSQHVVVTADEEHFKRVPRIRLLKLPRHRR
jgi:predicted nucleic acid-binding protein